MSRQSPPGAPEPEAALGRLPAPAVNALGTAATNATATRRPHTVTSPTAALAMAHCPCRCHAAMRRRRLSPPPLAHLHHTCSNHSPPKRRLRVNAPWWTTPAPTHRPACKKTAAAALRDHCHRHGVTTTFSRRIPPSPRSARKAKYPHQRRAREPHRPIQSARVAVSRAYTWLSTAFWRRPTHRNDTPLHAQQAARVRESSLRPTRGATCKRITVSATPHQTVGRQDQYRKRSHSAVSQKKQVSSWPEDTLTATLARGRRSQPPPPSTIFLPPHPHPSSRPLAPVHRRTHTSTAPRTPPPAAEKVAVPPTAPLTVAIASPTAAPDTPPIPTTATRCQRVPAVATAAVVGAVLLLTPTITATAGVATGSNRPVAAAPATGAAGGHLPPSGAADPSTGKRPPPVTAAASPPVSHSLRGMRRPPPPPARTTDDGDPSLSARLAPARPGPMDATVPSVQRETTDPQPGQEVRTVAAEGEGGCTQVDGACIMMGEEQGEMQSRLGKGAGRRGG